MARLWFHTGSATRCRPPPGGGGRRAQLALVVTAEGCWAHEGTVVGIAAPQDLLSRVLVQFDDGSDRPSA